MADEKTREIVKAELTQYLAGKGYRKTPERYAILDKIYTMNEHFDADSLFDLMARSDYRVSRATIYNTIELLTDAGLIRKHRFGSNPAQYEKTYNSVSHHHLICTQCGKIKEVKDADLLQILENKKFNKFTPCYYSLYVYGLCSKCAQSATKKSGVKKKSPSANNKHES